MGKRIMVAVIFVPLIILMLFFAPSWVLPVVVSGRAMIALHEVLWSTGFVKNPKISGLAIVLAGLIPFWVFVGAVSYTHLDVYKRHPWVSRVSMAGVPRPVCKNSVS